jgi:hypothetical protein
MSDRELMQMALDALDIFYDEYGWGEKQKKAHEALRARLAQPEEPNWSAAGFVKPRRGWQGLTDEEILEEYRQSYGDDGNLTDIYFARAIEAKLKEKNT